MRGYLPICVAAIVSMISSCAKSDRGIAPLPEAWPRMEINSDSYKTLDPGGKTLRLNSALKVEAERKEGALWLTMSYPQFPQGHFYLTLSRVADPAEAIRNRMERMKINAGGAAGEELTLTSGGGWEGMILHTPQSLTTPVQILAVKGDSILSGAWYMQLPPSTPADSVAPAVDAALRDMTVMLKAL